MGKSYNCGFRDKRYFDNKKKGAKKGTHSNNGYADNESGFNNSIKIKHFKN